MLFQQSLPSLTISLPCLITHTRAAAIMKLIDWCLEQEGSPTKPSDKESEAATYPVGFVGRNLRHKTHVLPPASDGNHKTSSTTITVAVKT